MKLKQLFLLAALIVATCLLSFSLFGQIPTSGLVAYWPMNGNFNDAGPNGIHGSNSGATATTNRAGTTNTAMLFTNPGSTVDQYATHPVNAALNFGTASNFTYTFLFYMPAWYHTGGLYDNNLNYGGTGIWIWNIAGPGQYTLQFNFRNNSIGSSSFLPIGTWIAIAAVKSGSTISIYINGLLDASAGVGSGTPTYSFTGKFGTMFFDGLANPNYNGFTGKLDEFRIYNRALSAAEIAQTALVVLPLKLGEFNAIKKSSGIDLNWSTLSEQSSARFEIERSEDGQQFSRIGTVNASGNSSSRVDYSFFDPQPLPATNFYRLRLIDNDGVATLSRIVAINNRPSSLNVSLFPNPCTDLLQLQVKSTGKQTSPLQITDASGRIVREQSLFLQDGTNAFSIPVQQLPAGAYFLIIHTKEGRQTQSFIRQ